MNAKRRIFNLSAAHLINDIYTPVIMAIQPVLISVYGYSYFMAATLPAMHSIVSSVLQPVFGHLSDKQGRSVPVSISLLLSGCGIAMLGLFPDYPLLMILCVAIAALGHASFHPAALKLVSTLVKSENRGRLTSFFVVGGNLGFALGPVIAGAVLTFGGFSSIAYLTIPAIFGALLMKRTSLQHEGSNHNLTEVKDASPWTPVILLFAGSTLRSWVIFGAMTFFPTLLVLRGYDIMTANLFVTGMLLCGVVGQVAGGALSDRYGRKELVSFTTLLSFPAFLIFLLSTGLVSITSMFLFGFLLWSSFAVTIAMSHELKPGTVGFTSGLFLGVALGAGGLGVSISGYLADLYGLEASLSLFPALILASAAFFLIIRYPWKSLNRERPHN